MFAVLDEFLILDYMKRQELERGFPKTCQMLRLNFRIIFDVTCSSVSGLGHGC